MLKKFFFFLFLSGWVLVYPQSLETIKITGKYTGISYTQIFDDLEKKYGLQFFYKGEWFEEVKPDIVFNHVTLSVALDSLFRELPYTYKIIQGKHIVVLPRAKIAELTGRLPNHSGENGDADKFIIIGNLADAGKYKNSVVKGTVLDGKTGIPIIGATIQIQNMLQGVVTNVEGAYKINLKTGSYTLVVSSVGYEKALVNIKVIADGNLNIELFDKSVSFQDVVIYSQKPDRNVSSHQMSIVELNRKEMDQLPSITGDRDVLKGLTAMPGVKSIGEFSSGINVRGGGEDQNLYLVNSAPLFSTAHVFGLMTVINPDVVEKLTLYKGHIPASYGERASSVVDIRTKESVPSKFRLKGGIGLYDGRLMSEIPLIKDKVFVYLAGRTSYSNYILKNMKDITLRYSRASFFDLNGTLHMNLGKNKMSFFAFTSGDEFKFSDEVRFNYVNRLGSFNWNMMISPNLASFLTLAYSGYNVKKEEIATLYRKNTIKSDIVYSMLKYRLKFSGLSGNEIDAGFNIAKYDIQPGKQYPYDSDSEIPPKTLEKEHGYEGAVFLNDEIRLSQAVTLNVGLRYSLYLNTGKGTVATYLPGTPKDNKNITGTKVYGHNDIIKSYHGFEPRLSARLKVGEASSVKVSYNRNLQYISRISYTSVSTPSDIWKLADPYIKPMTAIQYAIGYYRNFRFNTIEASAELYYKSLRNVIDYPEGANLEMNENIESELVNTMGKNYGIELMVKKSAGTVDGWVTYTYSRSLRRTEGVYDSDILNYNRYFPSSYDRPHDFGLIANYHIKRRLALKANFTYSTGRPITLPEYKYFNQDEVVVYFSDKNKYRIPDYHRLDVTLTFDASLKLKKKWRGIWSLSILNVYGRKNAYTIYYKMEMPSEINNYNRFSLYKLYLIGRPIPTLTYSFMF